MCYIAGSTLLADALAPSERASVQGATEVTINLTSAFSSLSSGFIMAALDFGALCMISAVLSLIPMGLAIWRQRAEPAAAQA
jgi:predicted MFS family arabinose efflux permease